jgi:ankyrin repeat protein
MQELIDRGCNVNATGEDNWTPLHSSAAEGETKAALELMRHGADNAVVAGTFGTPLHQAAIGGHLTTLRALLELGCPLDTLTTIGCTVLHHAAEGK